MSASVIRVCWWFLRPYKTAVYTKWHDATDTTVCLLCVGNMLAPKLCCCAQEASMAKVWWDCSSHRTPLQQVSVNFFARIYSTFSGPLFVSNESNLVCLRRFSQPIDLYLNWVWPFKSIFGWKGMLCFDLAPASSSESSSSLEQEKYLQAILDSIPIYFKINGHSTLSNRSIIGLSPGMWMVTFAFWFVFNACYFQLPGPSRHEKLCLFIFS